MARLGAEPPCDMYRQARWTRALRAIGFRAPSRVSRTARPLFRMRQATTAHDIRTTNVSRGVGNCRHLARGHLRVYTSSRATGRFRRHQTRGRSVSVPHHERKI